jgi:transcriptional regulator with XRE-family HTH domain
MLADVRIDGEKVRTARERRFLSQRELADKAEMNRNTVWRIESSGLTDVHPRTIRKLAQALSVEPASLAPKD